MAPRASYANLLVNDAFSRVEALPTAPFPSSAARVVAAQLVDAYVSQCGNSGAKEHNDPCLPGGTGWRRALEGASKRATINEKGARKKLHGNAHWGQHF